MTAEHFVDVEIGGDGYVSFRFTCTGGPGDVCHQWCAEGCEELCTADTIVLDPERVELVAQAPTGAHQWEPMPPHGQSCRVVDWLDAVGGADAYADEDEPHRPGRHPIAEEWTGADYVWTYRDPAPAVPA